MKNSTRSGHVLTLAAVMIAIVMSPMATSPARFTPKRIVAGQPNTAQSLSQVLNPDGTLNLHAGLSASLDARGWGLTLGLDGQPRFVRASQMAGSNARAPKKPDIAGDEWWDGEFQVGVSEPGYAANVYAIAIQGEDVYIGGNFTRAGGIDANSIVRFNTAARHWYALGTGISSGVNAILVNGNSVYVGGNFNDAGGQSVGGLARWDTVSQTWSGVGALLSSSNFRFAGIVSALALDDNGRLIVGGMFDHAGTQAIMNIASWNGTNWSSIGSGIGSANGTDQVFALAISGNDIYAGGYFTNPTSNIAHWNGSTWLSDMGGTNGMVRALLLNGNSLYVGGDFTQVGALTGANRIATWNGTYWSTLGAGTDNTVRSIALGSDGLYIGGLFANADGNPANYVSRWSGSVWSAISTSLDGEVDALAVSGGNVYLGGNFSVTDSGLANHLTSWSVPDGAWYALGNSPNGEIFAVAISGSDVYVGGQFNSVGGIAAHNIARWNSSTGLWSALGYGTAGCTGVQGCVGEVYAIAVNGYDVYAGGTFNQVGNYINGQLYLTPTGPVARWNPITGIWTQSSIADAYSSGSQLAVYALAAQGSGVVVGGSFLHAMCNFVVCVVNNVVYWDGSFNYGPLTNGVTTGTNDEVRALLNDGSGMYLGGSFTSPRASLAYFDGYDWFGLGGAINGTVEALAEDNQYLYAGGYFSNAGGSGANRIARLALAVDANWQPLGASLDGTVTGLAMSGNDLIAVGTFTQSGLLGVNHVARWSTSTETWSPLGGGVSDFATAVAATSGTFYVGGAFVSAGGQESDYLGRWGQYQIYLPVVIR